MSEASGADVARVEGAGDGGVFGAFEDGAAIGEDGHFIGGNAEAQEKIIVAEVADGGGEPGAQRSEIEHTAALVDLHRVAAAHGDVGLGAALEIRKFAADASAALGIAREEQRLQVAGPDIAGEEAAVEGVLAAGKEFQALGGFQRGDEIDDRTEHTDGVAGFFEALRVWGFEKAGETGSDAGTDGQRDPVTGNGRGVNPGAGKLDGQVVDEQTGFKVVGAVEDKVKAREKFLHVAGMEVGHDTLDGNGRIDGVEFAFGGDGFREGIARVGFIEEDLTLQVGRLDEVTIDDAEAADAGTDKEICGRGTDRAATHNDGAGSEDTLLPLRSQAGKKDLPGVFFLECVFHVK
jgi:hypothetical protein